MFVSNKRVYFNFVVVITCLITVEKATKANVDLRLRKSNPVEKDLYLVNN